MHVLAVIECWHVPAVRGGVVAQHRAAFAQLGPQQAFARRQAVAHRAHVAPCTCLRHQVVALQHLHHGAAALRLAQHGIGYQLQHLGQGHRQGRNALLHLQQLGMVLGIAHRIQVSFLGGADVGHATDNAHGLAGGIADDEPAVQHPGIAVVVAAKPVFGRPVVGLSFDGRLNAAHSVFGVVGVHAQRPRRAVCRQLGGGHAEQALHALVPPHLVGAQVPVPDAIGSGARNKVKALLAHAAGLAGEVLRRDVLQRTLDADDLALGIARGQPGGAHPEALPVCGGNLALQIKRRAVTQAGGQGGADIAAAGLGVQQQHFVHRAGVLAQPVGGCDLLRPVEQHLGQLDGPAADAGDLSGHPQCLALGQHLAVHLVAFLCQLRQQDPLASQLQLCHGLVAQDLQGFQLIV